MERIATGLSELIGRTPLMELQGYERAVSLLTEDIEMYA